MFEDLLTWRAVISAALATPSGLDDPSRIDAIRSLEQLVCAATAAQSALAAELDRSQRADHTVETTTPTGHTYRSQAPPVLTIQDYPARPDHVLAG